VLGDARGIGDFVVEEEVRVGGTRENLIDDGSSAGTAELESDKCCNAEWMLAG
jgi:hypothetical protein